MGRGHHRHRRQRMTRCRRCGKDMPIGRMKKHWRDVHVKPEERK